MNHNPNISNYPKNNPKKTGTLDTSAERKKPPAPKKNVNEKNPNIANIAPKPNEIRTKHPQKSKQTKMRREKLATGDVVGMYNKWCVLELLGSGGFGDVYRVQLHGDIVKAQCAVMCSDDIPLPAEQAAKKKSDENSGQVILGPKRGSAKAPSTMRAPIMTMPKETKTSMREQYPEINLKPTVAKTSVREEGKLSSNANSSENKSDVGQDKTPANPETPTNENRNAAGAEKSIDSIELGPLTKPHKKLDKKKKKKKKKKKHHKKNRSSEQQCGSSKRILRLPAIELNRSYAMKTECRRTSRNCARLKVEMEVLLRITVAEAERKRHFVELFDRGQASHVKFLVMSLVGHTLHDLRIMIGIVANFNKSTTMQIALQTLKAIEDLHWLGYIHRDIKPNNFACGIGDNQDIIYMLDFGIARRIFKPGTKELRAVRETTKFVGTVRYCSRASMYCVEQGRKDDLESWIFMIYFFFDNERGLPWRFAASRDEVLRRKEKFFRHEFTQCYRFIPKHIKPITDYINSLDLIDEPDYKLVEIMLMRLAEQNDISLSARLDWIGRKEGEKVAKTKEADERLNNPTISTSSNDEDEKSNDKSEDEKKPTNKNEC